jgi:hypothetical protein
MVGSEEPVMAGFRRLETGVEGEKTGVRRDEIFLQTFKADFNKFTTSKQV